MSSLFRPFSCHFMISPLLSSMLYKITSTLCLLFSVSTLFCYYFSHRSFSLPPLSLFHLPCVSSIFFQSSSLILIPLPFLSLSMLLVSTHLLIMCPPFLSSFPPLSYPLWCSHWTPWPGLTPAAFCAAYLICAYKWVIQGTETALICWWLPVTKAPRTLRLLRARSSCLSFPRVFSGG